jgi:hypothetical protein
MNTSGYTTLANNVSLAAGGSHIYNVTFNVTLDLNPGSGQGGNNVYTACSVFGNGPGSGPGQGLYNKAEVDRTGDGITDITDDACGDLPNITLIKDFVNVTPQTNGSYNVLYRITVGNNGGATGSYSLKDIPQFDDDVVINSGSYSGQASGAMNTSGYTTLANNVSLAAGGSHIYNVTFNVTLDLNPGSGQGGNNVYTACSVFGNGPGSGPGQGLYNKAEVDRTGDGITDITDDACGDLPSKIGDFVWEDLNVNGIQDANEPGISGVVVRLLDQNGNQLKFVVTDIDGKYLFDNLDPGNYIVKFDTKAGYINTPQNKGFDDATDSDADPVTGRSPLIVLLPGQTNLTIDAGYYRTARIGDFVWEDTNLNNLQDAFEPGISGVQVTLSGIKGTDGSAVNLVTTTDNTGMYDFNNLTPGNYTVTFTRPGSQFLSVLPNVGNDLIDSDADPVTGQTGSYTLLSGQFNNTVDAGYYQCAKIGDYVWLDFGSNANIQDAGDVGINNVQVQLFQAGTNTLVQTQLTGNNPVTGMPGYYLFNCVTPGTYYIKVTKPTPGGQISRYEFVVPNQGNDDTKDSDIVDFVNGSTLSFTVGYAQTILDIDIGLISILPVEISQFSGEWNKTTDVNELYWNTSFESNNSHFEIERSFNGSEFVNIGRVAGNGNQTVESRYYFEDNNIDNNGEYTYRLKQYDFDGKYQYSDKVVINVQRVKEAFTNIYPNPTRGEVNVEISEKSGSRVKIEVLDMLGRTIIHDFIDQTIDDDIFRTKLFADHLTKGVYNIMIRVDQEVFSHRLIIIE